MPQVTGVLETSLYVADVAKSVAFYEGLFQFERMESDERFCALSVCGKQVLLLFRHGGSLKPAQTAGGILPPHDGSGQSHLAFSIGADQWDGWLARLAEKKIAVESEIHWPRGGHSIYFRDPDGHLIELVTPGCWRMY